MSDYEDEFDEEDSGDVSNFDKPNAPEVEITYAIELLLNPNGFDVYNDAEGIWNAFGDEEVAEMITMCDGDLNALLDTIFAHEDFRKVCTQRLKDYKEAFEDILDK